MNKFSEFEKDIIRKIVATTEFKDAFLATLIDENTNAIALEWNLEKPNFKIIVRTLAENSNVDPIKIFETLKELIILLERLEDDRFIYLFENINMTKDNCLFNRNKYIKVDDSYRINEGTTELNGKLYQASGLIKTTTVSIPCDFGKYVQHFGNGIFHVSGSLRELVENNFETPEQLRHKTVLFWTRAAFVAALLGSIITSADIIHKWYSAKDNSLHNELLEIKQSIEQTIPPDVIKTEITKDTLTTRIVEMPKAYK